MSIDTRERIIAVTLIVASFTLITVLAIAVVSTAFAHFEPSYCR